MGAPAGPAPRAAVQVSARSPDRRPEAGSAIGSRFGEISPAFAATFGARVDVGFSLGARNAEARALAGSAHRPRGSSRGPTLPVAIPTVRTLPASRVHTTVVIASEGACRHADADRRSRSD